MPNPNGIEFDNLYLDMNGIIHPCTHPEDKPAPKNEDEMMAAIFECIDRLFSIVRPRKLLYMAIDGVAPRAKMNQQRSRRFRAAKETTEKHLTVKTVREELAARGIPLPPEKPKGEHFDSNCITPGTPFMERLSICLHYYIHDRLNNNPGWKGIKVILSDANVPGEGEHKLMDYIRKQRAQPDHDPNTQHVLCGADADLIMLGLATHEPNFTIIREEFLPNKPRPCEICGGMGHEMQKCDGSGLDGGDADVACSKEVQFIFVRLPVLKEYLRDELQMPNLPFKYEFERVIDDWVFMCFFVGNDFLPHLPSLEIREGAIDRLVNLYKKCVYKTGGYLTDSGDVNLDRVQMILTDLGQVEDEIFKNRKQTEDQFKARAAAKKRRMQGQYGQNRPNFRQMHQNPQFAPVPLGRAGQAPPPIQNFRQEAARMRMGTSAPVQSRAEHQLARIGDNKGAMESMLRPEGKQEQRGQKRKHDEIANPEEKEDDEPNDEVRLWEDGFKDRYYESKFDVLSDNLEFRYSVALQYVRGLCWVLKYYYQGCASWKWYFPYHYAPFASDFINITGLSTQFEKNTVPFQPLEQLMGVFPAASGQHVPEPWRILMSDPKSQIIDFYPEDFTIDLNGKTFAWQGVALLPFVDEKRLFKALKPFYDKLTDGERKRNVRGENKLYLEPSNSEYKKVHALYKEKVCSDEFLLMSMQGMQCKVSVDNECVGINDVLQSPVLGMAQIHGNQVLTVEFRDPEYADDYKFMAVKLPGAMDPPKVLKGQNDKTANYRPQIGEFLLNMIFLRYCFRNF